MTPHQPRDWKCLAQQASKEMDSDKLLSLVIELNRVLGEREESIQWQTERGWVPICQIVPDARWNGQVGGGKGRYRRLRRAHRAPISVLKSRGTGRPSPPRRSGPIFSTTDGILRRGYRDPSGQD